MKIGGGKDMKLTIRSTADIVYEKGGVFYE